MLNMIIIVLIDLIVHQVRKLTEQQEELAKGNTGLQVFFQTHIFGLQVFSPTHISRNVPLSILNSTVIDKEYNQCMAARVIASSSLT